LPVCKIPIAMYFVGAMSTLSFSTANLVDLLVQKSIKNPDYKMTNTGEPIQMETEIEEEMEIETEMEDEWVIAPDGQEQDILAATLTQSDDELTTEYKVTEHDQEEEHSSVIEHMLSRNKVYKIDTDFLATQRE